MATKRKPPAAQKKAGKKRKRPEKKTPVKTVRIPDIFQSLPDATFAIDNKGTVVAWNRAMERSTGIRASEIIGKGDLGYAIPFYGTKRPLLIDLLDEPDEVIREWGYTSLLRKGNALVAENPTIDPANRVRILWGLAAPIFDSGGNRIGAVQSVADVTRRRERETELGNTARKFGEILDNIGAATVIIEEDDTISFVNPEFGRILGYVREEIEGKKSWTEFVVPEDARMLQKYARRESLAGDDPVRYEARLIRWDGEVRNAILTITRIPGSPKLAVTILDITDKIRAESAVQQANRKLNVLTGIIRHDILNQLTVLKGNLDLAREITTDPRESAVLEKELAATNAIQALITFTRDYQDIGIAPPEWQDVRGVVLRSCAGIRFGDISLSVEIDGVEVYADRLLSMVFVHLVTNAVRHGRKTSRIRIYCEESFEELHIVCEDNGIGIPPEKKEKIFGRQLGAGAGLELYLAREILSITGIAIRETGIYGQGACFELCVPRGGYRFAAAQQ